MGLRRSLRESMVLGEILSMRPDERPVVFYAEDSHSWVQFEGYVRELLAREEFPVLYVTSDPGDQLLEQADSKLAVRYLDRQLGRLMATIEGSVVVMTMPDLGRFHVPKPASGVVLYFFHSLNSAHTSYRTGAFDHYDVFACTGPHHVRELTAMRHQRSLDPAELSEIGYYKLDRIAADHATWPCESEDPPEVLIAPSWGHQNLLESHGEAVIGSLLSEGFRVTVRPHPQFFHSLYPTGAEVVRRLQREFGSHPEVAFELSIRTEDSFHRSTLMVSDWSGAAYEYALGTLRPVLFVDTPPKIFNSEWEIVGLPAFEHEMREAVGTVVPSDQTDRLGRMAAQLIASKATFREQLASLREDAVFNPGGSAIAGADLIRRVATRL